MAWNRKEPDPFEDKRRKLAEQERLLAEQMSRLNRKLGKAPDGSLLDDEPSEPPVWRLEDDDHRFRPADPTPARKRALARQRQRDMIVFFIILVILFVVVGVIWYVAYVYNVKPNNGA